MKRTKLIPLTLGLATFLAGAQLAGAQDPDSAPPPPFCHKGGHDMTGMMTRMLQLTDAQKAQIEPLLAAARPQLKAIHEKARSDSDVVLKQLHAQIRPLLTPEQQKRLDAMELLHSSAPQSTE